MVDAALELLLELSKLLLLLDVSIDAWLLLVANVTMLLELLLELDVLLLLSKLELEVVEA